VRIARPLGPCSRPDNNKLPFGIENDPCSELLTFPIQCLLDPFNVPPRWIGEAKVLDLQGNQSERMEASAGRIQVGEIHQRQVVTVALVTTDPFIVVQKITAAIENETISINFDRSRMMRRMPVNDRHACLVDESPGKNLLLIRNVISPIGSQWIETTMRSPGLLTATTWSLGGVAQGRRGQGMPGSRPADRSGPKPLTAVREQQAAGKSKRLWPFLGCTGG
jgi:hypothetical protein